MEEAESAVQIARDSLAGGVGGSEEGECETDAVTWLFDAYHELGLAYQRLGRLPAAIELLGRACDAADPEDWPRWALARVSHASALISAGRSAEAVELLRTALVTLDAGSAERLTQRHQRNHLRDPRRIRCLALGELVRALTYRGELAEAARIAETVVDAERKLGMLGGRGQRALAQVELARGRPDRAVAVLDERMRQSATGSLSAHRVADLLLLAEASLDGGDPSLALETAHDGITLSQRTGAREHQAGLHVVAARAVLARGEIEAARAAVTLAHHTIDETGAEAYRDAALAAESACQAAARTRPAGDGADALTAREREVLALMAEGRTNRQIAEVLILSDKTVKRHLSNMFVKLGVGTRAAAVRCAFRSGML
jgi:DNA-binding NarL/FixJ family response regulator